MDNQDELSAALNFDPFAALEDQTGDSGSGSDSISQQQPQSQPQQQPQPQPSAQGAPTQSGNNLPAPAQQPTQQPQQQPSNSVAEFMTAMGKFPMQQPQPQGMPSPAPAQMPQDQPQPQQGRGPVDYSKPYEPAPVQIPQQLTAAIFGQDLGAAEQAMNQIIGVVYNSLAQRMHEQLGQMHQQIQQVPQQATQSFQIQQAQQELRTAFYGKFPELNTDIGRMAVSRITEQVAGAYQRMGQNFDPRSPDFIQYIGDQARLMLNMPAQTPQGQAPRNPSPAHFQTNGASRAGGGGDNPFMEALGFNFH